jgi:hypothetical protein
MGVCPMVWCVLCVGVQCPMVFVCTSVTDGTEVRVLLGERLKVLVDLAVNALNPLVHLQVPPPLGVGVAAVLLRGELLAVSRPFTACAHVVGGVVGPSVDVWVLFRTPVQSLLCRQSLASYCHRDAPRTAPLWTSFPNKSPSLSRRVSVRKAIESTSVIATCVLA